MLKLRHLGLVCFFFLILGTSTAMAQVDCTGVPQWAQPTIYDIGARVVFEGRLYECIVPSQIVTPPSDPVRWKDLGACNGGGGSQGARIVGSWIAGTTHAREAGSNRLLIFTAHVEHSAAITLNSVTYGGRSMTKVIERSATAAGSAFVAYTAAFILNESGVAAATSGTFTPAFSATPERPPAFSSVFLVNVNQTSPVGASASAVSTGATVSTAGLATASGDLVILAATNGNTGNYTVNNGFAEAIELTITSADGVAGSKPATGATETPSVTHSAPIRQSLIGLVIRSAAAGANRPPAFTNDPFTKPNATVGQAYNSSIAGDATDPDGDPLTFSKVNGPAWLSVASNGALSGTPAAANQGLNTFTVSVSDGRGGSDMATMNITVVAAANAPPTFTLDPFTEPNATVGLAYSSSIAGDATDPNGDALTFAKVSGPAWLSVASNGALSGTPAAANQGLNTFTVSVSDGRGGSDTATMNITVQAQQQPGCNIPKHILIGYWANFPNSGQFFPLRQVSSNYNVINIAFGLPRSPTDPTIQFEVPTQFYPTNQDFANDVATLQGQGRKVVLSIGGAAGGAFELNTDADRTTFVNSVFNLITTFGFDGIDVDFEGGGPGNPILRNANDNDFRNPTTPRIRNAILALRDIRNRFANAFPNRCFILSFAPETFFLQAGFQFYASATPTTLGCYIPVIDALRDITSWVHTQDYNTGTMLGLDGNVYGSGNADFHVAMSEILLRGFQVGSRDASPGGVFAALREDQVAFGLPASTAAAGSGFTTVQAVQNAIRYLTQRTEYAGRSYTLQKPTGAYPNFRGLMTWNVFHDAANNFEFSANHGPFLRNLP